MQLSQLTTDRALDVLCEIAPHVANIAKDQELMDTVGKAVKRDGVTRIGMMLLGVDRLTAMIPLILKNHRSDTYAILGCVNCVDEGTIAEQNVMQTAEQIREILQDKVLLDFFKSCAGQEKSE